MAGVWHTTGVVSSPAILERELFSEAEAGRLLGVPTATLHYWLQGGKRGGRTYAPVLRPEPVQRRWVTWAEFIEAGWLSEYRRRRNIPMLELRDFIQRMRDEMGVPYPLAHMRPFRSGRRLMYDAQQEAKLGSSFALVAAVDEQLVLTHPAESFVERVDWSGDIAGAWRPTADLKSSVRISPETRFGRPAVNGVSTLAIYEESQAGASYSELSEDFLIEESDVKWAISYEAARHAA